MSEIIPAIGKRLTKFRTKVDISQKDVADIADVSRAYVAQVETGRANPSFKLLYQLRINHNLSIDWLLSGQGEMIVSKNSITDRMTDEHHELLKALLKLDSKKQSRLIGGFLEILGSD